MRKAKEPVSQEKINELFEQISDLDEYLEVLTVTDERIRPVATLISSACDLLESMIKREEEPDPPADVDECIWFLRVPTH